MKINLLVLIFFVVTTYAMHTSEGARSACVVLGDAAQLPSQKSQQFDQAVQRCLRRFKLGSHESARSAMQDFRDEGTGHGQCV